MTIEAIEITSEMLTDDIRARALEMALANAELSLNLKPSDNDLLDDRVTAILAAAQNGALEPRLYRLAWFLRSRQGFGRRQTAARPI